MSEKAKQMQIKSKGKENIQELKISYTFEGRGVRLQEASI